MSTLHSRCQQAAVQPTSLLYTQVLYNMTLRLSKQQSLKYNLWILRELMVQFQELELYYGVSMEKIQKSHIWHDLCVKTHLFLNK